MSEISLTDMPLFAAVAFFFFGGGTFSLSLKGSSSSSFRLNSNERPSKARCRRFGVGGFAEGLPEPAEPPERSRLSVVGRLTGNGSGVDSRAMGLSDSSGDGASERARARVFGGVPGSVVLIDGLEGDVIAVVWDETRVMLLPTETEDEDEEMGCGEEVPQLYGCSSIPPPGLSSPVSEFGGVMSSAMDRNKRRLAGLLEGEASPSAASILRLGGLSSSLAFVGLLVSVAFLSLSLSFLSVTT